MASNVNMIKATMKIQPGSELSFWYALNYRQLRFIDMESSLLQKDQDLRTKGKKLVRVDLTLTALLVVGLLIAAVFSLNILRIMFSAAQIINCVVSTVLEVRNLRKRKRVLGNIKGVADMIEQERQGQSPLTKWNYRF